MNIVDRVYPSIAIHAQASGRHSSTNPPVAQWPDLIQSVLIPDEGQFWIGGDFSGQEVWIGAAETNDTLLLDQLRRGWDSHTLALCDGRGWDYPTYKDQPGRDIAWLEKYSLNRESFKRHRKWFKSCRLALNYGKDSKFLFQVPGSAQLGVDKAEGIRIANRYFAKHPALKIYLDKMKESIYKHGIVRSFSGRRRVLYEKGDKRFREGINGPMQQGGADMLNLTICRVCGSFPEARYKFGVHDSFWFSFPLGMVKQIKDIQEVINQPFTVNGHELLVPIEWKFKGIK